MSRSRPSPPPASPEQAARDSSRRAHDVRRRNENPQDFSRRDVQRGTQRSETEIEGGRRHDDGGSYAPEPLRPELEHGDARRPHKRAGR